MKRTVIYACAGGVLLALLKYIEYQHLVRVYPAQLYGGLIALIFAAVGVWAGVRLARKHDPAPLPAARNDEIDTAKVRELGITPREHEILGLIAEGLSNREIGEKLFVSENTVKTHSSRIFEKLDVSRRTQAVQKAKQLRLIL